MDHKEQHRLHHQKEREHKKKEEKEHERQLDKKKWLPVHPAWLLVLGGVLLAAALLVWTLFL